MGKLGTWMNFLETNLAIYVPEIEALKLFAFWDKGLKRSFNINHYCLLNIYASGTTVIWKKLRTMVSEKP